MWFLISKQFKIKKKQMVGSILLTVRQAIEPVIFALIYWSIFRLKKKNKTIKLNFSLLSL